MCDYCRNNILLVYYRKRYVIICKISSWLYIQQKKGKAINDILVKLHIYIAE